jgi:hypothetical protein
MSGASACVYTHGWLSAPLITSTLMMEAETVTETFDYSSILLADFIAREKTDCCGLITIL